MHSHFSLLSTTSTMTVEKYNNNYEINIKENIVVKTGALLIVGGLITYVIANDTTGVGVADDLALFALIPLFVILGGEL